MQISTTRMIKAPGISFSILGVFSHSSIQEALKRSPKPIQLKIQDQRQEAAKARSGLFVCLMCPRSKLLWWSALYMVFPGLDCFSPRYSLSWCPELSWTCWNIYSFWLAGWSRIQRKGWVPYSLMFRGQLIALVLASSRSLGTSNRFES